MACYLFKDHRGRQVIIFSNYETSLIQSLHGELLQRKLTVATAESCTSGLAAFMLTSEAGSSAYYRGGVCCYSNDVKQSLLGVPTQHLEKYGAVSQEVAIDLAKGCRKRCSADIGLSFTGIAGPEGGSARKPVGTVWGAICYHDTVETTHMHLEGGRHSVRWGATVKMLEQLLKKVREI